MDTKYYKILAKGHRACHRGTYRYTPNRWTRREKVDPCNTGFHICKVEHLSRWLYAEDGLLPLEIWEVEAEGVIDVGDKCVAERIRIINLVGTLDDIDLRWLGTEFAITVLGNTDDTRVSDCIQTVRAYSMGMMDDDDLAAAGAAAGAAAESAARSAAWFAAGAAAESAARSAAWFAAWSAAWFAAWSAAWFAAWSEQGQIILDFLAE